MAISNVTYAAGTNSVTLTLPASSVPSKATVIVQWNGLIDALGRAVADGHDQVHLPIRSLLARPDVVGAAQDRGLTVVAWTVDRPADLLRCREIGVHGVISDDPSAARAVLEQAAQAA